MALPSSYRLKSRKDFQAVFREGIRRHGSYLTLRALRPPSLPAVASENASSGSPNTTESATLANTLIGISVSTKVSKKAVIRNRIKRQISAAFYQLQPKILPGWRLVVVVKPSAAESKCVTQQFLQELEQLLAQAEVLHGHS